ADPESPAGRDSRPARDQGSSRRAERTGADPSDDVHRAHLRSPHRGRRGGGAVPRPRQAARRGSWSAAAGMNAEAARLIDQFTRAHEGDPWQGSPVKAILKGVTAEQAARKPPNGAHSIWELVLHMTAWRNETARRATGAPAGEPAEGDYPSVGDPTPARWTAAPAAFDTAPQHPGAAVRGVRGERT